uniref:Uncharacterized protein n=1 Tax=Oryza sativa subsp. japonica TaxID=39947 RepID=Q67UU6_ORYSJ|nr:hypothetical protein [Oryza sativa Japonica Group]
MEMPEREEEEVSLEEGKLERQGPFISVGDAMAAARADCGGFHDDISRGFDLSLVKAPLFGYSSSFMVNHPYVLRDSNFCVNITIISQAISVIHALQLQNGPRLIPSAEEFDSSRSLAPFPWASAKTIKYRRVAFASTEDLSNFISFSERKGLKIVRLFCSQRHCI